MLVAVLLLLFLSLILAEGRRGGGLIAPGPAVVIAPASPDLLLRVRRLVNQRGGCGVEVTAALVVAAVLEGHRLVRLRVGGFGGVFWRVDEARLFFV